MLSPPHRASLPYTITPPPPMVIFCKKGVCDDWYMDMVVGGDNLLGVVKLDVAATISVIE